MNGLGFNWTRCPFLNPPPPPAGVPSSFLTMSTGATYVVTGANRGIGLECVRRLSETLVHGAVKTRMELTDCHGRNLDFFCFSRGERERETLRLLRRGAGLKPLTLGWRREVGREVGDGGGGGGGGRIPV